MFRSPLALAAAVLIALALVVLPAPAQTPPNDDCTGAIPLAPNQPVTGQTTSARPETIATCSGTAWANAVWYRATGTGHVLTAGTCSSQNSYDTILEVYSGDCAQPRCVGANDNYCGLLSRYSWCSTFGATYLIAVHGFAGASGAFTLTLQDSVTPCGPCAPPDPNGVPENEPCGAETNQGCNGPVGSNPVFQDILGNCIINGTCPTSASERDTDWYQVTVPLSGTFSVTLTAEMPAVCFILILPGPGPCGNLTIVAEGFVRPCETTTVTSPALIPGRPAIVFIAGTVQEPAPCGSADYILRFNIGVPCPPICPCDFNASGVLNSQDLFDFLTCFFTEACPPGRTADYNADGTVNSQDFFDFLACFMASPPGCA